MNKIIRNQLLKKLMNYYGFVCCQVKPNIIYKKDNLIVTEHIDSKVITLKTKINGKRFVLFHSKINKQFSFNKLIKILNFKFINIHIDYQNHNLDICDNYDIFHPELGITEDLGFLKFLEQFNKLIETKNEIKISTSIVMIVSFLNQVKEFDDIYELIISPPKNKFYNGSYIIKNITSNTSDVIKNNINIDSFDEVIMEIDDIHY